jgi:hypothetical protein
MQDRILNELIGDSLNHINRPDLMTEKKMQSMAIDNAFALKDKQLPDPLRIPTAEELLAMRNWAIGYKSLNKRASAREIRKAVQRHFHIKIYK